MNAAVQRLPVHVHTGNALRYMGDQYATGAYVLRELAQNGIDKRARNILIRVDCPARLLQAFDDGNGAGLDEIAWKFANVADSDKDRSKGDLGEKGIGNLAGPAVADEWQLTTRDALKPGDPLRVYTLRRAEMEKRSDLGVDMEVLPSTKVNGAPFAAISVVRLKGVDEIVLKQIGDRDCMEKIIRESFSHQIRDRKINVVIAYKDFKGKTTEFRIKPTQYRGQTIDSLPIETEYGLVEFKLFYNAHPVDKPTVVVQHQGANALPISNFFMLRILPREIEHLFAKGYFEGEITLGFCEQNSDRTAFRPNHECQMFAAAVTNFAEDVLSPMIQQFEDEDRSDKLRKITERALRKMRSFLMRQHMHLPAPLKAAVVKFVKDDGAAGTGTGLRLVPGGHAYLGGGTVVKTTETASGGKEQPAPGDKPGTKAKGGVRTPRVLPPDALKKQKEETHRVRQAIARGDKTATAKKPKVELVDGLSVQLVDPDPSDHYAWRSRTTAEGVIQVNVVSSEFMEAERRGSYELERFELLLLQKELTCAALSPAERRVFDQAFEQQFLSLWRASLQG